MVEGGDGQVGPGIRMAAHPLSFLYQGEYSRLRSTRHYGRTDASRVIGSGFIRAEETLAPMSDAYPLEFPSCR